MKVKNLLLVGVLVCLLTGCGGQMAAQTVQEAVNSSVASGVEPTDSVTEPAMDGPEDEAASAAESAEPVELEVIIEGLQKLEELDDGYVFRERAGDRRDSAGIRLPTLCEGDESDNGGTGSDDLNADSIGVLRARAGAVDGVGDERADFGSLGG